MIYKLKPLDITAEKDLKSLIENRKVFCLSNCELNIFETFEKAYNFPLTFSDMVLSSMIAGKKRVALENQPVFDYFPGESVIIPPNKTMVIDFPEAALDNPAQCISLSVDSDYIKSTLNFLNEYYNNDQDEFHIWQLNYAQNHFSNDSSMTLAIDKLIEICSSGNRFKHIYADLCLKELLIRLIQSQRFWQATEDTPKNANKDRMHFILRYINENLNSKILISQLCKKAYITRNSFFKLFKEQFGISPGEYIVQERIKLAKQLLLDPNNKVTVVSMQCGFFDTNHFIRLFKKFEGITPGTYQGIATKVA